MHRLEHARVAAARVDVAARSKADAAADGRADVGEDVAEEVVGDDDVEALRLRQEEHRGRVDVAVVGLHLGVLNLDAIECLLPCLTCIDEDVRLVDERDLLAPLHRALESVADDPLGTERGVDADLGRHLLRRALAQRATGTDIRTLGALAAHDEVNLLRSLARERTARHAGVELHRAQVDVVVHDEPQGQEHTALEDPGRNGRVADRPEQDRVVAAQLLDDRIREELARLVVTTRTQVVLRRLHVEISGRRDGGQDLQGLDDDLGADAVAGDEGNVQCS